jgi:hypothetical protein
MGVLSRIPSVPFWNKTKVKVIALWWELSVTEIVKAMKARTSLVI